MVIIDIAGTSAAGDDGAVAGQLGWWYEPDRHRQPPPLLQHMQAEAIVGERIFVISNRPGVEDLTGPPLEAVLGRPVDRGFEYRQEFQPGNFTLPLRFQRCGRMPE
jgi:hypothetical protein